MAARPRAPIGLNGMVGSDRAPSPPPSPSPPSPSTSNTSSPSITPIVFLDIDGVICCNHTGTLEEDKLQLLRRICKKTGAQVVLSSDWRRKLPLKQKVQRALERIGVRYLGCTRVITTKSQVGSWTIETNERPREITKWLGNRTCPWVAIDDRDLLSETGGSLLGGHFVHTEFVSGLTPSLAEQAIAILSADRPVQTSNSSVSSPASTRAHDSANLLVPLIHAQTINTALYHENDAEVAPEGAELT